MSLNSIRQLRPLAQLSEFLNQITTWEPPTFHHTHTHLFHFSLTDKAHLIISTLIETLTPFRSIDSCTLSSFSYRHAYFLRPSSKYNERRKDLFLYLYGWLETRTGTEEIQLHQHQMRLPNMGGIPKIS